MSTWKDAQQRKRREVANTPLDTEAVSPSLAAVNTTTKSSESFSQLGKIIFLVIPDSLSWISEARLVWSRGANETTRSYCEAFILNMFVLSD